MAGCDGAGLLINERGPYVRGRVIDLTVAAARALGFSGLARVHVAPFTKSFTEASTRRHAKKASMAKTDICVECPAKNDGGARFEILASD
jgi:rare lipoprotein A (peptidoglycan hydrolase)